MKDLIDAYIEDHETAWAPTTLRSERSRLHAVAHKLDEGPESVYAYLTSIGQKPYTIKTTFIRIVAMEKWANRGSAYATWVKKHANRFKHAYKKEELEITYEQASELLTHLNGRSNVFAKGILETGLRLSEAYSQSNGSVIGKGGKLRKIYGRIEATVPKSTFARELAKVGLKPHTLRKLCATRLAEQGASAADLCKVFGWSSIATSYQYLQAKDEEKLAALMAESRKGS